MQRTQKVGFQQEREVVEQVYRIKMTKIHYKCLKLSKILLFNFAYINSPKYVNA